MNRVVQTSNARLKTQRIVPNWKGGLPVPYCLFLLYLVQVKDLPRILVMPNLLQSIVPLLVLLIYSRVWNQNV